ncbi:MAG: sigma 54-interacting transcriptional regulator, partial [Phycisphaerae bacterium]
ALLEASAAISSSLEPDQTLSAIARTAATVMHAQAASVLLLDRRRNKLIFKAAYGGPGQNLLGEEFDADLGIAGKVASTGQPMLVDDVRREESWFPGIDEKTAFQTRGLIAAPMIRRDRTIGVVEVMNKIPARPFTDADLELLQIFANLAAIGADNAQLHERLKKENVGLRDVIQQPDQIIGTSQALRYALDLCDRVAPTGATVLLLGETGTGKELVARRIHNRSPRRDRPFVALNCAALPETLLESELFGHEKGAFTGAVSQKVGRFELADGGSLFLDEIGEISQAIQIKLLRVLQEKQFVRVGGTRAVATDVRIIAATNRDLQAAMARGTFRQDLYYRLNVFPIELPPLRNRREDIPLLVQHFVQRSAAELAVPRPDVSDQATAFLAAYNWPGNIRELQNVIERAVLLADGGTISSEHLPREIASQTPQARSDPADSSLFGYEKAIIVKALIENDWNQSRAARALGISRDNIRYRIKKYNIRKPG